jgi:hypothetical protein
MPDPPPVMRIVLPVAFMRVLSCPIDGCLDVAGSRRMREYLVSA